ncbi:hypothetical protein GMOD_00006201 [Pyrenophora seminiperda CCB06]|uniref:Uncharacterized protein n=1 Tax=Pyrenophora seminiperda CCB06 TaxID=1302712 RepID=A0A3M7M4K6_9PLEO|nr:hypothetical protein GMOD_00006201 [Pyrenophora seminiperda CCB06]
MGSPSAMRLTDTVVRLGLRSCSRSSTPAKPAVAVFGNHPCRLSFCPNVIAPSLSTSATSSCADVLPRFRVICQTMVSTWSSSLCLSKCKFLIISHFHHCFYCSPQESTLLIIFTFSIAWRSGSRPVS